MGKYLKKFETTAEYESFIASDYDKPNVSLCEDNNEVHYNPIEPPLPNNIIRYEASAKLAETSSNKSAGLHTNAFNTTIKSHTFENGVGTIEFNDDVTTIAGGGGGSPNYGAFGGCSNMTNISIPNSVTSITSIAFVGCTSLPVVDNIRYADTYAIGAVDKTLTEYTIKNGTKWIGDYAFQYCSGLTSVTIPSSVTSIGYGAFSYCSSLTSVTIPDSVTSIGNSAFYGCSGLTSVTIPSSVTTIGNSAFSSCSGLTSVTIPSSVTTIGDYAFSYCSGLTSVTIGSGVTSIGRYAFSACGLTSIVIPDNVTSMGGEVFRGCSDLTSVTIGSGITSINTSNFWNCYSITNITIDSNNTVYDSRNNCNAIIETATNTLIMGSNSTIIPNSVTSIGYGAFQDCSDLTSVTIPSSVTSIGGFPFIGSGRPSVITVESTTPPTMTSLWETSGNSTIYVPAESVETYKTTSGWSTYASIIQAIP